jgi:hypothetical protein
MESVLMLMVESEDCTWALDLWMMTREKVAITSQTAVRTKYLPNRDKQHEDHNLNAIETFPIGEQR